MGLTTARPLHGYDLLGSIPSDVNGWYAGLNWTFSLLFMPFWFINSGILSVKAAGGTLAFCSSQLFQAMYFWQVLNSCLSVDMRGMSLSLLRKFTWKCTLKHTWDLMSVCLLGCPKTQYVHQTGLGYGEQTFTVTCTRLIRQTILQLRQRPILQSQGNRFL